MQVFQGQTRLFDHQPASAIRHYSVSGVTAVLRSIVVSAVAWLVRPFAVILGGRPRAEDVVASEYEGRAWCDSTERELVNDIATWPHRR
jgi:hypothetical protein